jgi:hypothetical protein
MSYRVYVDTVYGVRPKRGERSYKGRLLKASDAIVQTMEEAQEFIDTMVKHDVPDYCHAIETRSIIDLTKQGVYVYAEHKSTEILICSYA